MPGFDNNFAVMGEWLDPSPNHKKRSKAELEREVYLEDIKNKGFLHASFQEKPCYSSNGLSERIAARTGFKVQRLKTESIFPSRCLAISSPAVSPATLLESPVFLSTPLTSPTTGKLSSLPSDKAKDEFNDEIATSLALSLDPTTNIGSEPDDSQAYEQAHDSDLGDSMPSGSPEDDGYNWRKYGQKLVKGSEYPRSYYKCTHPNCEVKKKVERSREGHITEIIYVKAHNHLKPPTKSRSVTGLSGTSNDMQIDGTGTNENLQWTSPVSEEVGYGSHSGSMQVQSGAQFGYGGVATDAFSKDEEDRTSYMSVSLGYHGQIDESEPKRRKLETSGSTRGTREPKVVVKTTSDIDILEDGYRWRKYGQKVVKGNPNPRSYYKCTANGCNVTKHVERASDDLTSVLTTYIGKHNHAVPAARNSNRHVNYPMPHSSSEELVTANSSLHDFQPYLRSPSGFSVYYVGETELTDISMSGLPIEQERFLGLEALAIGDPDGLMLQLAAEPKVEQVSQQELGLSRSSLIDIMSRLPQI
ncbi:hypothetical protein HID58_012725 [Brassica napus]|uniref:WRKY domain-containing protein n=1 Tax=Brassica napus TaxID=3708 RepID=A0ABQ8E1W4_BRANA|nr:probable WRKY transcription factor 34 [Brassica napus]KAH0935608.1 hypothetical protein HID58_012725 [Brassica napus]